MKSYKDFARPLEEVTVPKDDGQSDFRKRTMRFLQKHQANVVKVADPAGNKDDVFKGNTKKKGGKRKADYADAEDEQVYEQTGTYKAMARTFSTKVFNSDKEANAFLAKNKGWGVIGEKSGKVHVAKLSDKGKPMNLSTINDVKEAVYEEMSPVETRAKERIVKGMKKNKDQLMKRYGDDWRSVMHATATKMAVQREQLESILDESCDDVNDYYVENLPDLADEIGTLVDDLLSAHAAASEAAAEDKPRYIPGRIYSCKEIYRTLEDVRDILKARKIDEAVTDCFLSFGGDVLEEEIEFFNEAFKAGSLKLNDGKTVNITRDDASTLNEFYKKLNADNRKQMESTIKKSAKDFNDVLQFAKEAV